jgi:hypothetical protein
VKHALVQTLRIELPSPIPDQTSPELRQQSFSRAGVLVRAAPWTACGVEDSALLMVIKLVFNVEVAGL